MSLEEATPLATALVDSIAKLETIRALILKGPLSVSDELRPERPSYDVDILVAPDDASTFAQALTTRGWQLRPSPKFPTLAPDHSRTFTHPNWPVDIDVHWKWPGFLLPDHDAFEILWARRRSADFAGTQVLAPSRADSALILALHILREERNLKSNARRKAEYEFLVAAVLAEPETRTAIRTAASELHATHTALRFFEDLGFAQAPAVVEQPHLLEAWNLHQQADHPVSGWLHEIDQEPLWRRPITTWRALFPTPSALRAIDPYIGEGKLELFRGWWRRLLRGIRTLPEARSNLNAAKRSATTKKNPS